MAPLRSLPSRAPVSVPTMGLGPDGDIAVTWSGPKPTAFRMTTKGLDVMVAEMNRLRRANKVGQRVVAQLQAMGLLSQQGQGAESPAP